MIEFRFCNAGEYARIVKETTPEQRAEVLIAWISEKEKNKKRIDNGDNA